MRLTRVDATDGPSAQSAPAARIEITYPAVITDRDLGTDPGGTARSPQRRMDFATAEKLLEANGGRLIRPPRDARAGPCWPSCCARPLRTADGARPARPLLARERPGDDRPTQEPRATALSFRPSALQVTGPDAPGHGASARTASRMSARLRPACAHGGRDEPHRVVAVGRRLVGRLAPARRVRLRERLPRRPGLDQEGRDHALRRRARRAAERGAAGRRPADDRPAEARPAERRDQAARQARRREDDARPAAPPRSRRPASAGRSASSGASSTSAAGVRRRSPSARRSATSAACESWSVDADHRERPAGRGPRERVGQHRGDALVGGRQREEPRHVGVVGRGVGAAGAEEQEVALQRDLHGQVRGRPVDPADDGPRAAGRRRDASGRRSRPSRGSPTRRAARRNGLARGTRRPRSPARARGSRRARGRRSPGDPGPPGRTSRGRPRRRPAPAPRARGRGSRGARWDGGLSIGLGRRRRDSAGRTAPAALRDDSARAATSPTAPLDGSLLRRSRVAGAVAARPRPRPRGSAGRAAAM